MNRFLPYWTWITAGILIVMAGWIGASTYFFPPPSQSDRAFPKSGFSAPEFELNTLEGETLALNDFHGKVTVINFWASWCPPCKSEMPAIQAVASDYPSDDLVILGINSTYQDDLADVRSFVTDYELSFSILLDVNGDVSRLYQVQALPTTFFIDQDGVIQKVIIGGPLSEALIRAEIDRLLEGGR